MPQPNSIRRMLILLFGVGVSWLAGVQIVSAAETSTDRLQTLIGETATEFQLAYRLNPGEWQARQEQLEAAVAAWRSAPRSEVNDQRLANWLHGAIDSSLPGSTDALAAVPSFKPNEEQRATYDCKENRQTAIAGADTRNRTRCQRSGSAQLTTRSATTRQASRYNGRNRSWVQGALLAALCGRLATGRWCLRRGCRSSRRACCRASAPSSSFFFFFFFIVSLRTRTFGSPSGESPSFQRSASCNRAIRSTRVSTLRLRVAPRLTLKLLSIVMRNSPAVAIILFW